MASGDRLLVIGGSGFLGSHTAAEGRKQGLDVVTASRDGSGADVACDVTESASVRAAIGAVKPDLIANMAGMASVAESWKDPDEAFELNERGAMNVVEAALEGKPVARLLLVSSAEVYGEPRPGLMPLTEDAPIDPVTPYGKSKAAMEASCGRACRAAGLELVVVRPFNQIGPGQAPEFVASSFARQVAEAESRGASEAVLLVGNLESTRDFTDVRDSARAYVALLGGEASGVFNLCSEVVVPIRRLIEALALATPLRITTKADPHLVRPADPPAPRGSAERLREGIGWMPEFSLEQTVADLLDWWRAGPAPASSDRH